MTTEQMPKRHTGVYSRTGSNVWQWKIRAPKDLRHAYPSEWAHRCSLGTSDLQEANRKAVQLHAEWVRRFDEQRQRLNPQKLERITPAMAKLLAETLKRDCLAVDEDVRTNPKKWVVGGGIKARLRGMPEVLADALRDVNREQEQELTAAVAMGQIGKALPAMESTAEKLGLVFDSETPGFIEALEACLHALKDAASLQVLRDNAVKVETPPAPTLKALEDEQPRFLRDVFERWQGAKKRGTDAVKACGRALKLYEQHTGNPPIQKVTRAQGDSFRAWLQTLGTSSKTAHDRLTWVKSLLGYAARDLEWLTRHPWEGLDIEHRTENKRTPWTAAQVQAFFSLPLFTKYELPQNRWKAGGAAAYWIPILGLYTGARLGELCQLRVVDVITKDEQWFISINDEGEESKIKTEAAVRDVPLHSELLRLGFLEYVRDNQKAGNERLWPALKFRDGKPSGYFSAWFSEVRKLVPGGVPDFHAFRHTVRTAMAEGGFSESIQDRITGHAIKGSIGTRVYSHPTAILRRAVEAIKYAKLNLPSVYGKPKNK